MTAGLLLIKNLDEKEIGSEATYNKSCFNRASCLAPG